MGPGMNAASLVVGVEDYAHAGYRESHNRLRYAVTDAGAFNAYARAALGSASDALHHLLTDRAATAAAIERAATELARLGPFDLLLVYLSGHGDRDESGRGWFCSADAEPGSPSVDAGRLDRLLRPIEAATVMVFIDCCYAEAVVSGSALFGAPGPARARLVLCSARADQRAWEDDELKQSVFSHLLLYSLSTASPVSGPSGRVDVDTALFPYLRDQVPLLVFAKKQGMVQEPVKGGFLSAPVELPTVTAHAFGRELTLMQTVRARLHRIIAVSVSVVLAGLVVLDLTVYHLALDAMGRLEVRPGPNALFATLPFHLSAPIDTGITTDDLAFGDRRAIERLAKGSDWGIWPHLDSDGVRDWLSRIEPMLARSEAVRVSILATGRFPKARASSDRAEGELFDSQLVRPPIELFFFLCEVGTQDASEKASRLYKLPYDLNIDVNDNPKTRLDFEVLNPKPDLFAQDLAWSAATAPRNRGDLFNRVEKMVMLTGYRSVHASPEDGASDFMAFARAIRAISRREEEHQADFEAATTERFRTMARDWCRAPALLAFGLLGDATAQRTAEAVFLEAVNTYDPASQADLLTRPQGIALQALATLAARRSLAPETVLAVFRFIAQDKRGLGGVPDLVEWLATIAARQQLPEEVVNYLVSQLEHSSEPEGFGPLQAFRILCRSSQFLKPELLARLSAWVASHGDSSRRQDAWAEGLGYLAAATPLPEKEVRRLADRIAPDVYFSSAASTARGALIIRSTDVQAGVALGRVAQHQAIDNDLVDLLTRFALARPGINHRDEVLKGLAVIDRCSGPDIAACLHARLLETRSDSARRMLAIDIGVQRILLEPESQRAKILDGLRERWLLETEPETRIALARLIGRTRLEHWFPGYSATLEIHTSRRS
jgi:Caspase domain